MMGRARTGGGRIGSAALLTEGGGGRMCSRARVFALSSLLALLALALLALPSAASATCTPGWRVAQKFTHVYFHVGDLSAISGMALAVGDEGGGLPVILRWDGSSWSKFSPSERALRAADPAMAQFKHITIYLHGVHARTPTDAWAVGAAEVIDYDNNDHTWPVTLHWDGSGWRFIPTPRGAGLHDVVAFGPDDAWALGSPTVHWDGSSWTAVMGAPSGTAVERTPYANIAWTNGGWRYKDGAWKEFTGAWGDDVAVRAWNDVWTVGGGGNRGGQPYARHFDGTRWTSMPTAEGPVLGLSTRRLYGVSAVSSNDVWAVGMGAVGMDPEEKAVIEHWDGSSWTVVPSPTALQNNRSTLMDVAMRPSGYGWAFGSMEKREADGFKYEYGVILRHCPG